MKKIFKQILCVVFVLVMIATSTSPAFAAATINKVTGTVTVYRTRTSTGTQTVSFDIANSDSSFTIKRSDVKVTAGTAGAKFRSFYKESYTNSTVEDYYSDSSKSWTSDTWKYSDYSYRIGIEVQQAGTSTITYKIGTKSYTITLKVLAYVNPVKTITCTGAGVSKDKVGKSFASLTKSSNTPSQDVNIYKSEVRDVWIQAYPIDGWKIRSFTFRDQNVGTSHGWNNYDSGLTVISDRHIRLVNTRNYSINLTFVNTKNNATMTVYFYIRGTKA